MTERTYENFDLIVERSGDSFRVRVIASPCGQAATEFATPFSPLELENFVLRMGRPQKGMRRMDSPEMEAVKLFGTRLFQTVFSEDVYACYVRSMDNVLNQDKGLRIRLHINVPEFHDLPWEYLYHSQVDQFLALSKDTPIIRYLELPYKTQALPIDPPLRILVMISSPEGYPPLNIEEEWKRLNIALGPLIKHGLVLIERLESPTLGALQQQLRREQYHIFHFIGHGKYFESKQDGKLLLEDEAGRGVPTSGQHLGTILHDHHSLRLIVLNACEGARTSSDDPYAGVAQTLVRQGIPAVLAMQFEIFENAAITLAHEFYSSIVDGYSVDAALSEARKAIFATGNDVEWGTPVLFTRAADGILFERIHLEDFDSALKLARQESSHLAYKAGTEVPDKEAEIVAPAKPGGSGGTPPPTRKKPDRSGQEPKPERPSTVVPAKQPKQAPKSNRWMIIAGGLLVLLLCTLGGFTAWKIIIPAINPPTNTPSYSTKEAPFATPLPPVATSTRKPTSTKSPVIPIKTYTVSPTPSPTWTPTKVTPPSITPFAPEEPEQFIIFYWETIIYDKNYPLAWSLLTDHFKEVNNPEPGGYETWKSVVSKNVKWERPKMKVEYLSSTMAVVSITEVNFYTSSKYALRDIKYCLIWDKSRNTWMIEYKTVCGL